MTVPVVRRMESLSADECVALLSQHEIGRLGLAMEDGVEILPVAYAWDGDAVVFRTGLGRILEAVSDRDVAFEIDGADAGHHGWSVLVRGRAEEVWRPDDLERARALPLSPWAPGGRDRYVRVVPAVLTGRRVG
jgi:uncharacterized protein